MQCQHHIYKSRGGDQWDYMCFRGTEFDQCGEICRDHRSMAWQERKRLHMRWARRVAAAIIDAFLRVITSPWFEKVSYTLIDNFWLDILA